jgi:hypothetical protein
LTDYHFSQQWILFVIGKLFGEKRSVVVYANQERRTSKINDQNEVLAYIGEELNALRRLFMP